MVTTACNAYCVISMEGDDDTYEGKTAGSHICKVGATVNSLLGDHFHIINNTQGSWFNVSFTNGIHNLLHKFLGATTQSCYIGTCGIRSRVVRGPCCITLRWMPQNTFDVKSNLVPVLVWCYCTTITSLRLCDAYMRQQTRPSLVQIMACGLISTKPLSESMLPSCQLDLKEHISVKFYLKFKSLQSRKCTWKCCMWNGNYSAWASMCELRHPYPF